METKVAGGDEVTAPHWPQLLDVIGAFGSGSAFEHIYQSVSFEVDGIELIAQTPSKISKQSSIRHLLSNKDALNEIMDDDYPMSCSTIEQVLSALSRLCSDKNCVCPSTSFLGRIVNMHGGVFNFGESLRTECGRFWSESTYAQAEHVVYVVLLRESSTWVTIGVDRSCRAIVNIIAMGPFPDETTTTFLSSSGGNGQELAAYVRAVRDVDIMLTSVVGVSMVGAVHDADVHRKNNYAFAANRIPRFDGSTCGLVALNAALHFVETRDPVSENLWAIKKYPCEDLRAMRKNALELYMVNFCDQLAYVGDQRFHKRSRQRGKKDEGEDSSW